MKQKVSYGKCSVLFTANEGSASRMIEIRPFTRSEFSGHLPALLTYGLNWTLQKTCTRELTR